MSTREIKLSPGVRFTLLDEDSNQATEFEVAVCDGELVLVVEVGFDQTLTEQTP